MNNQNTIHTPNNEFHEVVSDDYIISLIDIIEFLKTSMWMVAATTSVALAFALFYVSTATPLYTASTVLIIHGKTQAPSLLSNLNGLVPISDRHLQGQIEIIKSPGIARKVVATAGVAKISQALADNTSLSETEKRNRAANIVLSGIKITIVNMSNVIKLSAKSNEPKKAAFPG